ncbi:MAG: hypothetical protein PHY73_05475 [Candidatus Omnitrophica bacterium]|nr:hypothetical protein [Candidatus Omnitrophota bacterium]
MKKLLIVLVCFNLFVFNIFAEESEESNAMLEKSEYYDSHIKENEEISSLSSLTDEELRAMLEKLEAEELSVSRLDSLTENVIEDYIIEKPLKTYQFLHDYIDCLHRLEVANMYAEMETSNILDQMKNINTYISYLNEAKEVLYPWAGEFVNMRKVAMDFDRIFADSNRINMIAGPLYAGINYIQTLQEKNLKILDGSADGTTSDIVKNSSDMEVAWVQFYRDSANLIMVITQLRKDDSEIPIGKIPHLISDEERYKLIGYLNKLFKDKFKEYNELAQKYKYGAISEEEFNPTIVTYCALHLKKLLSGETYEESKARDESEDPYYFELE